LLRPALRVAFIATLLVTGCGESSPSDGSAPSSGGAGRGGSAGGATVGGGAGGTGAGEAGATGGAATGGSGGQAGSAAADADVAEHDATVGADVIGDADASGARDTNGSTDSSAVTDAGGVSFYVVEPVADHALRPGDALRHVVRETSISFVTDNGSVAVGTSKITDSLDADVRLGIEPFR
jgi:hypothetical protein